MDLECLEHEGKFRLRPRGALTGAGARRLLEVFRTVLADPGYCYTLDLRDSLPVDESAAALIAEIRDMVEGAGASFQLVGTPAVVRSTRPAAAQALAG